MTCDRHRLAVRIGKRIENLRQDRGWTRRDLADATGLTESHLSKLVSGKHHPTWRSLGLISIAFEMSLAELFDGVEVDDIPGVKERRNQQAKDPKKGAPAVAL